MAVGIVGTLKIGGDEFDVLSFSVSFDRRIDNKGRPSSYVMGGLMSMTIETTAESKLISQMINKNEGFDGTIEFVKAGQDNVMRTVEFTNGFIISYTEGFDTSNSSNFVCSLEISSGIVKINKAELDQRWPVAS